MFQRTVQFIVRSAIFAVGASLVIAVGLPLVRISAVWKGMEKARALVSTGDPARAVAYLERIERAARPFPHVRQRVQLELVRSYVAADMVRDAERNAGEVANGDAGPGATDPLVNMPAPVVDTIATRVWRLPEISPWTGYEQLLSDLYEGGRRQEAADIARRALKGNPPDEIRERLAAYTQGHVVPAPREQEPIPRAISLPEEQPVQHSPSQAPTTGHVPSSSGTVGLMFGAVSNGTASVYGTTGKRIGELPAGTLVSITGLRSSKSGELAVCAAPAGYESEKTVLLKGSDLMMLSGDPEELSPEVRSLVVRRARLEGELADHDRTRREEMARRNPHHSRFTEVTKQYKAYLEKVSDLRKKHDATTGPTRMKLADDLRAMIERGTDISAQYKRTRDEYTEWLRRAQTGVRDNRRIELLQQLATARREMELRGLK